MAAASAESVWQATSTILTGVLAIVGILTVRYMRIQANRTADAAEATARSAEATRQQTAVLTQSQRPHIMLTPYGEGIKDVFGTSPRVLIKASLAGQLLAHGCNYEAWAEVIPRPSEQFTPAAVHHPKGDEFSLVGNSPLVINVPLQRQLTDAEGQALRSGQSRFYVRVRFEFADPFQPDRRFMDCIWWVGIEGLYPATGYPHAN